jgi:hypothetical protein
MGAPLRGEAPKARGAHLSLTPAPAAAVLPRVAGVPGWDFTFTCRLPFSCYAAKTGLGLATVPLRENSVAS